MLLGIIEPDEGSRELLGRKSPRDASDLVGYLPEERGLYPSMKAKEAIAFMGALRGLDWKTGRARAVELLEAAGLGHAADEKIRKLSKGMAQLVQLLGSVVHQPKFLVLDEPFSGLDPVNQERLEKLILAERDRGATVLFSTHVMAHAERLCDRLAIIAKGKRRFEGTVADARATLPYTAHYVPHFPNDNIAATLPADARREGDGWRFTMPEGGIEDLLLKLINAGYGISGLSIERPGLHDAFVRIVGEAALTEDAA
jgi:ABC-2 type transport system ATP-binding protein